ncbi:hypothetical protein TcasGA2_TC002199 [Tribolium castaneum]|uniref:Uncharacterized protein n=1 Tax=Tribolium castaneum TaxID=7070 RepID=D6WY66_TRICA|nr:hypothetical protein TcasGA2_TC002199 [Tribolium castaneum]
MSLKRFLFQLSAIRFDNSDISQERITNGNTAAAISKIFNKCIYNCNENYSCSEYVAAEFGNAVWSPVLQRDIRLLEKVQRKVTRQPFRSSYCPSYEERLTLMRLPTLAHRRVRGDLLTTFQAITSKKSPIHRLFRINSSCTRGHLYKLQKPNFKTSVRQNFITNRIFNSWNALPSSVVTSPSSMVFKIRYDAYYAS